MVCERWRNSFSNFIADVGPRPTGASIGRKDNDGNYEPGNCRWETALQQGNNKRNSRFLEFNGIRLTAAQWSRELGIPYPRIRQRLFDGMPIEKVLSVRKMVNQYS